MDVVERRCGVEEREVDALSQAVATVTKAVERLQGKPNSACRYAHTHSPTHSASDVHVTITLSHHD